MALVIWFSTVTRAACRVNRTDRLPFCRFCVPSLAQNRKQGPPQTNLDIGLNSEVQFAQLHTPTLSNSGLFLARKEFFRRTEKTHLAAPYPRRRCQEYTYLRRVLDNSRFEVTTYLIGKYRSLPPFTTPAGRKVACTLPGPFIRSKMLANLDIVWIRYLAVEQSHGSRHPG